MKTGNNIGDDGTSPLAQALKANGTLKKLWLNGEQNNHEETQREKHGGTWWMAGNGIGPAGAAAIADALTHNVTLEELGLYGGDQDHRNNSKNKARFMIG